MPYKDKEKWNAYKKKVMMKYSISVSKVSEQNMIDFLERKRPVNGYIKRLILEDMQKQN